ncbi:cytochrome c prime [Leptothrix cholodnii SP-6]|jgi:cytochrome c556|uniref:Cytochrome c prime n=1 Tax=Leptothrix cholodnii (strain ATCC 51168 / LMG 8142 / SP-6) TaxID=395495 RepID=B1Y490_LEPCP|nr:cytochrome c [Leptothrix cholodnii]ACB35791.1 cytochrome c prime [Leptothrix cholodnii SP-6]
MKRFTLALSATVGLFLALPAAAQFQKPEDAIKYRKSAFTVMGSHFGRIGAVVQGKAPFDAKTVADNAQIVATMSMLPFAGFVPGSDKGDTRAKPEVWTEMDKVKAGATKMQEAITALNAAAKTGNLDQIKVAFGEAGKTCKGCHDNYRKD